MADISYNGVQTVFITVTDDPDWANEIFATFDDVYQLSTDNLEGMERIESALGKLRWGDAVH